MHLLSERVSNKMIEELQNNQEVKAASEKYLDCSEPDPRFPLSLTLVVI